MPNPLYGALASSQTNAGDFSQIINDLKRFQQTFKGDPKKEVEKMLASGQLSQNEFNQYGQMANQILALLKRC